MRPCTYMWFSPAEPRRGNRCDIGAPSGPRKEGFERKCDRRILVEDSRSRGAVPCEGIGFARRTDSLSTPRGLVAYVTLTKHSVAVRDSTICFGCNQTFQGNPIGLKFESDLVPLPSRAELSGLFFHPGHLIHYARRRDWHDLVGYLIQVGPSNF